MDDIAIIENDVIGRYVRNELPPDEEAEFEEAYFSNPELAALVEAEQHLHAIARAQKVPHLKPRTTVRMPVLQMAASFLVGALIAGFVVAPNLVSDSGLDQPQIAIAHNLELTRSSSDQSRTAVIRLKDVPTPDLGLSLDVPDALAESWEITLIDSADSPVWSQSLPALSKGSQLTVRVPKKLLHSGPHQLIVSDTQSDASFQFGFTIEE